MGLFDFFRKRQSRVDRLEEIVLLIDARIENLVEMVEEVAERGDIRKA